MDPLRPIDVRRPHEVDPVTVPVRLTPVERDAARERREQARRKRRQAAGTQPEPEAGHVDLRA